MRAILRSVHSPDVDDLDTYHPKDPLQFEILLQLLVGPLGQPGEESFDVSVCSVEALRTKCRDNGPVIGNGYLVVEEWDFEAILDMLTKEIEGVAGKDWAAVAQTLTKIGRWEFDNYH